MLANVVALVPRVLLDSRQSGVILAIVIGSILSLIMFYFFLNALFEFPGSTQPEIVWKWLPKWFAFPYLLLVSLLYFMAAWLILVVFIDVTKRFINPEISPLVIGAIFLFIVCLGAMMKSDKTLYALEIVLLICLPLIIAIFLKSFLNQFFSWDSVKIVFTHAFELPKIDTIGAAAYSFIGFYYMSVFSPFIVHRKTKIPFLLLLAVGILGLVNLFTSLLVPIGFHGFDGVKEQVYPWFTTADSIRLELGFVERVLFVFLLLYVAISIISATLSCHAGLMSIKKVLPKIKWKSIPIAQVIVLILFSVGTIWSFYLLTLEDIYKLAKYYFIFLLPMGFLSIFVLLWAVRRKKNV